MDLLVVAALGAATALATGLGAIPVWFVGGRSEAMQSALEGVAAGVMVVAAIAGLLLPAVDEGTTAQVVGGTVVGIVFLLGARVALARREVHVGNLTGAGVRRSALVFGALFVHSFPEGFAVGTAYASSREGLGAFVVLAIAIQNVPEGTATAVPMNEAGFSRSQQFWAAVATSLPQPVGAVIAYALVEEISALLPLSFAFAAGAMLALVVVDLLPAALLSGRAAAGAGGLAGGGGLMLLLTALLQV